MREIGLGSRYSESRQHVRRSSKSINTIKNDGLCYTNLRSMSCEWSNEVESRVIVDMLMSS